MSFSKIYEIKYKNQENIVTKVNNQEKYKLALNRNIINKKFNKNYIETQLLDKSLFNSITELIELLSNINIIHFFKDTYEKDIFFQCIFHKNNIAWISVNDEGKYRYFTKYKNKVIFMDSIDLLQIFYKCRDNSSTLNKLIKKQKIVFYNDEWTNCQRMKYTLNFDVIHSWEKYKEEFPKLNFLIESHLKVYETLNVLGNLLIKKKKFNVNGDNVFFVSNSYISKFCSISQSKANKIVNLFAVLGLIKKIKEDNLPCELIVESKKIAQNRALGNTIMYYIIPNINDILPHAEECATKLINNKIDYKNISKKKLESIFDSLFVKEIYPQIIQKNKSKEMFLNDIEDFFYDEYEKIIMTIINKKSFCTKQDLFKSLDNKLSAYKKETLFNNFKNNIMKTNNLIYIKPTNDIKNKLNVSFNNYIFIKSDL